MKYLLYIFAMKFRMATNDPKKFEKQSFFFVNEIITREGTYERRFAEYMITFAEQYGITILQIKPTQGLAKKIKFRGYGKSMWNLNQKIKTLLK